MKKRILKYIYITVIILFALPFIAAFGGPAILKGYVQSGIGDCKTMPVLCATPERKFNNLGIDKSYLSQLLPYSFPGKELPYSFPGLQVSIPKGFVVVRGSAVKVYYKRKTYDSKSPAVYLLYQKPKFFINLFPQLRKQGMENNYDFVSRTLKAQFTQIDHLADAFFVIMKSVFTPDVGDQKNIEIVEFRLADKKGFITYNLTAEENYFDCDIIDRDDAFFKIYIKDKNKRLNLDKVFAIISTLNTSNGPVEGAVK